MRSTCASTACLAVSVLAPPAVVQVEAPAFTPELPFSFADIVVAVGLIGAHLHDRALRNAETKRNRPAE